MKSILFALPVPRFFSQLEGVGGHVSHVSGVISAFYGLGFCVHLACAEPPMEPIQGISDIAFVAGGHKNLLLRQPWNLRFTNELVRLANSRDFDFCYLRYSAGYAPWLATLKRRFGRLQLILEVNSIQTPKFPLLRIVESRALQAADIITAVTPGLRDQICRVATGLQNKVVVIRNGVDPSRFPENAPTCEAGEVIKIGYVGVLKPGYGIEMLIQGVTNLLQNGTRVEFHIYGPGPLLNTLKNATQNFPEFSFHGAVSTALIPSVLNEMDLMLYSGTSATQYHSPVKLFEYMAAGKPVIATRNDETGLIVEKSGAGLLYDETDVRTLVDALTILCADRELRVSMGKAGRQVVITEHTWTRRMEDLLSKILTAHSSE